MTERNPGELQLGGGHDAGAHSLDDPASAEANAGPRVRPLAIEDALPAARERLERAVTRQGQASTMVRTMAHAPNVLAGYQEFARAMKKSDLTPRLREQIALAVAGATGCEYCRISHQRAARTVGLDDAEIAAALEGHASDPAADAVLRLAVGTVADPHAVTDADLERLRELGFSEAEIVEILGDVALNLFTNLFNIVTGAQVDEPGER